MKLTKKQLILTMMVPSVIAVVLLGIGFIAGRYTVIKTFKKEIQGNSKAYTLGGLLKNKEEKVKGIARTYHEDNKFLENIDNISWAVPNIPSPFVGTAPMPGQHGSAHINSMQFRSEKEVAVPKSDKTYRIFITGGSTAFGSGAQNDNRTIGGYLNEMLSKHLSPVTKMKYEVFTMANPAWASTHERIIIENRLSELEPDMIISFSGYNDAYWGKFGRNILWFSSFADEYFLRLIREVYRYTDQPKIPEITRIEPTEIPPFVVANRLIKNVKLSLSALSEKNMEYVFVLQPTLSVTNKKLTGREQELLNYPDYFRKCYDQFDIILKSFHKDHYQYINLSNIFDGLGDHEDIFIDSSHFGDKGYKIIAKNIFLQIKDRITR